jgi:hypothetical protein
MGRLRLATAFVFGILAFAAFATANNARAQLSNRPFPRAPCGVLSGHPCMPFFCGAFHRGPCTPQYLPPIGEDLRLTIVSTDDNDPANKPAAPDPTSPDNRASDSDNSGDEPKLDSLSAMYAALRACWVPPPKDEARHGMEYTIRFAFKRDGEIVAPPRVTYASHDAPGDVRDTYRDAVNAALARCTPLHFTDGMGGAVAGRPIAIRFVDNRTTSGAKLQDAKPQDTKSQDAKP